MTIQASLRQEAYGWGWQSTIHPEDLPRFTAKWRTLRDREASECEVRLRRSDGVFRWFLFRVEAFRDESHEVVRSYGMATDIEDRKHAEDLADWRRATPGNGDERAFDGGNTRSALPVCRKHDEWVLLQRCVGRSELRAS